MKITNEIKLELNRYIDKDYECKHSVLTIYIGNQMLQKKGIEAEALYDCVKDLVDPGEDIKFDEEDVTHMFDNCTELKPLPKMKEDEDGNN